MENMAPGYRFYPTEEELISFYLMNKLKGEMDEEMNRVIPVLDIYDYNPSQLPQVSGEASAREREQWFFFIPRQESEARGGRPKRLTSSGYWKATGSPNHVYSSDNRIIGMKRTMVFYNGRAPNGTKTDWKMNEYKAILHPHPSSSTPMLRQEYSLCRVYKKSKCLRSFDRRPPPRRESGATASSGMNMNPAGIERAEPESKEGLTSTTSSYHPQVVERGVSIASSPESSSSGDQAQAYLDDEPLLDWEQVDWFLWDHQKP